MKGDIGEKGDKGDPGQKVNIHVTFVWYCLLSLSLSPSLFLCLLLTSLPRTLTPKMISL